MKKISFLILALCLTNFLFAQNADCPLADTATVVNTTNDDYKLTFNSSKKAGGFLLRWKLPSETEWNEMYAFQSFPTSTYSFKLEKLPNGITYQAQLGRVCNIDKLWGKTFTFTTKRLNPPCGTPDISIDEVTNSGASLSWKPIEGAEHYVLSYRYADPLSWWSIKTIVDTSFKITNLTPNKTYEFDVYTDCGIQSGYRTDVLVFTTLDIPLCKTPSNLKAGEIATNSATISWTAATGNKGNTINYRVIGSTSWKTIKANKNSYVLTGLNSKTNYEFQVSTNCDGTNHSEYSAWTPFTTKPKKKTVVIANPDVNSKMTNDDNPKNSEIVPIIQKQSFNATNINIYPNPTNQFINLKGLPDSKETLTTSILDMTGKIVLNSTERSQIDISNLENGIYLVKINTNNRLLHTQKVVVMKN
jgi:hypothetical protein